MASQRENEFLEHYQRNLFQENKNDLLKTADIKRKCIAQTFKTAVKLVDNTTTCDILDDMLSSYSELVDDQNGINNYADTLQVLTSQVQKECPKWKSNLHNFDVNELIEPLSCGSLQCKNNEVTEGQIKILFEKSENVNPNVQNSSKAFTNVQSVSTKIYGNASNNFPSNNSNTGQSNNFSNNCFTNKPIQNSNQNFSKNTKPLTTSYRNPVNNYKSKNNNNSPNNSQEEKKKFNAFKTAKDEYIQQMNKPGTNGQQAYNPGPQKKSLGARRGVTGKFMPPVKRELVEEIEIPEEETEEIDERLRNIDAKMVELIRSEIMDCGPPITWDDIAGLEFAKTAIKEAVIWPLLRPDIFTGLRRPPKGILLFGPPGTGKTLIGKCIASQSQSTFFSISASSLTSKWIGDGEKMVRAMFAVARCHQPAVIFIDEIDSLLSQRSDTEHESSRRIKTEFLVQLDGAATAEEDRILLVGATNRPQELDEAARRRFVKRLYIPLPEKMARLEIVQRLISTEKHNLSEEDMTKIADLTDGYSGADMKNLCSEASLGPIRSIDINLIANIHPDEVGAVTMVDFQKALCRVRTSVSPSDLNQYVTWDKTYGSGGW